ncbi:MAG: GNAT family N-acetyltransferase [Kouleothrix sp.]|nr:GNAT family N-acetyltransferase [Kouleothrix sp.]
MQVIIRPASAEDRHTIKSIVRAAWLNPLDLDWPRFLIAQWGQDIIGVGQVKQHGDSSRELASLAVVPEWHGQGVGTHIIHGLLARESGVLYLMCAPRLGGYYARFGFQPIADGELPPYFRRIDRASRLAARLLRSDGPRVLVMRRL